MMASILDKLDSLGDQHPHRVLYSYIDVNGNPIGDYSYESFLHRTKVIAGHLRKEHGFKSQDRVLLAYPPGLEMICAFFGCVRAGLIPVPVYPPSSRGFQGALEATRTGGIDGHRDQSRAHAAKKRANHFEPRRVGEQNTVLRLEPVFLAQVSGDHFRPVEKRLVGVVSNRIAVHVDVRIENSVWVLIP